MASFLGDIKKFNSAKLNSVETVVKTRSGEVFVEKREDGELKIEKKSVEDAGFVIDLTPDLVVGVLWPDKLLVSSQDVPRDLELLKQHKITHVINLCSNVGFHTDVISFLSVMMYDTPEFKIKDYFTKCFAFMDSALSEEGSRVLVHCNAGRSRSVTVGLAYLMLKRGIKWRDGLEFVKKTRPQASPNEGFRAQLDEYQKELKLE